MKMIKRMKKWINLPRIRSRFLAAIIVVSLPPLFVLGYVSFHIAKDTLVQNHIQTIQGHLKTSSKMADLMLQNMIDMNRIILSNDELRQMLYMSGTSKDTDPAVIGVKTANLLQNIVVSNLFDTQYVDSICLFDRQFRSVCYGRSEQAGKYGADETRGTIATTDWYQKSMSAKGMEVFFGYNVLEDSSNNVTFSSVKVLRDPNHLSGNMMGLLVINMRSSIFRETVNETDESGFLVLDPDQQQPLVVYDYHPELTSGIGIGATLQETFDKMKDAGYLYTQYVNAKSGWIFVHFVKTKALLRQSDRIGMITMMLAALMAVIALFVSYIVSGTITRPLLQLKKMIVDWAAKGQLTGETNESFLADEVGVIGQTFQRMTTENQLLSERLLQAQLKEREAELRTLQAQIKPHFLYNTLDSIYWMSMLEEKPEIAQMALSLSESFKLSLNKGKETIPVFKELKHIEHYLIIQNLRYNNRFEYIEHIDPTIMTYEILKLMLQPLVENAIYHGLEPKVGPGTIRLTGRKDGEYLVFAVSDDGVGMEDIKQTERGYGIQNVRERLMIFYGPRSLFSIVSKPKEGTTIELRFLYGEQGENN
jgi:two-component system sensor histidine kinase YesM